MERIRITGSNRRLLWWGSCFCFVLVGVAGFHQTVDAQEVQKEGTQAYQAVTTADPNIPVENLMIKVRPLMKSELEVEANAWMKLLKQHAQDISEAELALKSRTIKAVKEVAVAEEKIEEKIEEAATPEKAAKVDTEVAPTKSEIAAENLEEKLIELRTSEALLLERVNAVLDELNAKGGDISEYQTYLNAVTGLRNVATTTSLMAVVTGWLRAPEGGVYWGKLVLRALVILLVFWILSRFAGNALVRAMSRRMDTSTLLKNFVRRTAGWVVLAVGILMAVAALGVEVGPLMAAMGAGGFIVGFALQETLSNFASGLMIMIYRPFDTNDFISVGGETGKVKAMSLVATTLTTVDNKNIVIPNKKAWGDTLTNYSKEETRRVDLVMGISYTDDIQQAIDVLLGIAMKHELVLEDPAPVVKVSELADSSVNLLFLPWSKTDDYWTVYWDLTRQAKEEFDAAGISIPFPQRDIHVQEVPAVSHS